MTNENERASNAEQHPFFHTMVLMGSALAIGCGGMSNDADGGGRSGAGGSGGTGPNGGSGGTGGTTGGVGGMGGVAAIGGTISFGGRTTVEPGPFTCSPAQWDCTNNPPNCNGRSFALPDQCRCDETRPKSATDCADGQVLACRLARYNNQGMEFTEPVPFECSCVAAQLDCGLVCDMAFADDRGECNEADNDGRSVLCGCAVIVLR